MKPFNNRVSLHIQSLDLSKTDREDHPHMAVFDTSAPFLFEVLALSCAHPAPINNVSDGIPAA
jgi:hypothetical protein